MAARHEGWLDQAGLNMIRCVIGSFLCAVAWGVPTGYNPNVLFELVVPNEMARQIGVLVWSGLSLIFILGVMLRGVTLILVGLIFSSAIVTFALGQADLGAVWQSTAFGAAVLLCYTALRPYEMYKAVLFPNVFLRGSMALALQSGVVPRRVRSGKQARGHKHGDDTVRRLRPVIAPTERMIGLADGIADQDKTAPRRDQTDLHEDEVLNIFAPN